MKFDLVGYVRFICQVQDISDMIKAWTVTYPYQNFTQKFHTQHS